MRLSKSEELKRLKEQEKTLLEKLEKKKLSLGEADGAMQSRYPSGRFELEQDIQIYQT